jgi:hypothetical protein
MEVSSQMSFEMVNKTRTAETEITEVLYAGQVVGTVILLYKSKVLEGLTQINTKVLDDLANQDLDDLEPQSELEVGEEAEIQEEFFETIENNHLLLETEEFVMSYVQNQAAAADKPAIQVKHCYGTWIEKEQLEFNDDSLEFPELDDQLLSRFLEADVNDINIVKTSPNFKTGYLLYQLGDEEYKVGEVTISSRGTSNRVRVDFWTRPTKEITFYAVAVLVAFRGRVAGGRIDYYYDNNLLKSALIPTP